GMSWRMNYFFDGKDKTLTLGKYPAVGIKDARTRRDEAKEQLAKGIDPAVEKKLAKTERYTFEAAGERWYEHHAEVTVPATHKKSRMYLDALNKKIGGRALPELDRKTLVDAVQALQGEISIHFAHRAAGVLKNVIEHAYNEGRATECHAYGLAKALKPYKATNRAALINPAEFGELLRKIWNYNGGGFSVPYCLKILPYLALRSEEIRGARWSELDLDAALWTVPATRHEHGGGMKMRIEHTVPLPRQVVSLFRELREKQVALLGDCELCFPSPRARSRHITSESLMCALKVIHGQSNISIHGFRSSFSTLAREEGFNPDHVEKQLAHQLKDSVEAAYNKAEYLEPRRKMMQEWANYLDSLRIEQSS
ncbi:MAG: tyrosine-type recombinase/integrase, partial [Oscillospiraceae bacterium]|nr:tyrosine-type recombinase/integrase [Oscillospiraceae bacterium]